MRISTTGDTRILRNENLWSAKKSPDRDADGLSARESIEESSKDEGNYRSAENR
jgi:hypothetical protein